LPDACFVKSGDRAGDKRIIEVIYAGTNEKAPY
jgi:hypothetical protein